MCRPLGAAVSLHVVDNINTSSEVRDQSTWACLTKVRLWCHKPFKPMVAQLSFKRFSLTPLHPFNWIKIIVCRFQSLFIRVQIIIIFGNSMVPDCQQAISWMMNGWWSSSLYICICITRPNSLLIPPRQNGCHFADDILRCIFMNEKFCISIIISPKFVPKCPIDNRPAIGLD